MSKIEQAEELIYKKLESFFGDLDILVGQIKRQSKYDDTFDTGEPISEIVRVSLEIAERFRDELLNMYSKRSQPLLLGKDKFDDQYRESVVQAFSEFSKYCLTVLEETTKITKQTHLYGKEYPGLHQSLQQFQEKLSSGIR